MIREWLARRNERKAMERIEEEVQAAKDLRERCIAHVQYLEHDTPEQMIRAAEAIRIYVEGE